MEDCPDEIRHKKIIEHQNNILFNTRNLNTELSDISKTLLSIKSRFARAKNRYEESDPLFVGDLVRIFDEDIPFEDQIRGRIILINQNPEDNYYILESNNKYPEGIIHHRKDRKYLHFLQHSTITDEEINSIFGNKLAIPGKTHIIE